jgi:hypothetical protein
MQAVNLEALWAIKVATHDLDTFCNYEAIVSYSPCIEACTNFLPGVTTMSVQVFPPRSDNNVCASQTRFVSGVPILSLLCTE